AAARRPRRRPPSPRRRRPRRPPGRSRRGGSPAARPRGSAPRPSPRSAGSAASRAGSGGGPPETAPASPRPWPPPQLRHSAAVTESQRACELARDRFWKDDLRRLIGTHPKWPDAGWELRLPEELAHALVLVLSRLPENQRRGFADAFYAAKRTGPVETP